LVQDIFTVYQEKINSSVSTLGELRRDANADSYPVFFADQAALGKFNIIYDIEETRLSFETQNEEEAVKLYRILREHRIITPNLNYIRENTKNKADK
jgi:hypothetical protein